MIDETELARRLTATLRARAEQEERPLGRFDPERPDAAVLTLADAPPARRRLRRPVVLAAAVAAIVGGAAVAWSAVPSDDTGDGDVATAVPVGEPDSVLPSLPDGVPVPTAPAPDGMSLWGVDWDPPRSDEGADLDPDHWTQLFADADDPEATLLVNYHTAELGRAEGPGGPHVTVRGHDAVVGPYGDGAWGLDALHWQEGDMSATVAFRGMTPEQAVAAVDALRERPGGGVGFDAPADGSLTLLDEALDPVPPAVVSSFGYASEAPIGQAPDRQVSLRSSQAVGRTTSAYLKTWFVGERSDDGVVVAHLPEVNHVDLVQPDGQAVGLDAWPGSGVSQQVLEQLARSVRPSTADQLGDLWSEVNDRVASLPVIASVELPSGTIEVHGLDGSPRAVCLRLAVGTSCPALPAASGEGNRLVTSLDVDGIWYVAVATTIPGVTLGEDVPVESGTADGWDVRLARPAGGITSVDIDDDSDTGMTVYRPLGL